MAKRARDALSLSKWLSFVLRHDPGSVGLALDDAGWVAVDELLAAFARSGQPLSRTELEQLVAHSDKQRFALSADGARIRANQGHSVHVELGYTPHPPPDQLFHGTVERFVPAIRTQGLVRGARHHVHLSASREQALVVAQRRRGTPVVLLVDASAMAHEGLSLFCSANGVWLADHVPARFLRFG